VECTILLYDMVISDVRKAIQYLGEGNIEGRTNALVHGLLVLEQLQGGLQMESGGDAAKHLYRLYSLARAKILEGQIKCRAPLLAEIVDALVAVRVMWVEVREKSQPVSGPEAWPIVSGAVAGGVSAIASGVVSEEIGSCGAWSA